MVEDTPDKRIVGEFDSPRSYLDNTGKGVSFDDYNRIRNNCFSARGTDCHYRKIHKNGFATVGEYVRVFIFCLSIKA